MPPRPGASDPAAAPLIRPVRPHPSGAEMVGSGRDAGGSRDDRHTGPVRADPRGHRRPADGAVRHVRQLRHAGAGLVRRDQAGQGRRAPGAGPGGQRRADHRHAGELERVPGRGGDDPGGVRHLLRGRGRAERGGRDHRRAAGLRAPCGVGGHGRDDPVPAGGLVAGVGGVHPGRAAAVAADARGPAPRGRGGVSGHAGQPHRGGRAGRGHPGRPGQVHRGQAQADGRCSWPRRTGRPGWPPPTRGWRTWPRSSSGAPRCSPTRSTATWICGRPRRPTATCSAATATVLRDVAALLTTRKVTHDDVSQGHRAAAAGQEGQRRPSAGDVG